MKKVYIIPIEAITDEMCPDGSKDEYVNALDEQDADELSDFVMSLDDFVTEFNADIHGVYSPDKIFIRVYDE